MAKMKVDFTEKIGKIKPMHGVGQPPLYGKDDTYFKYLTEANIPFSRLHDVGGAYGGNVYVDIPNIFRDFQADETDPASYDFAFTDWLLLSLKKHNCAPVYRLGVSIENYHTTKAYRIYPPADMEKWARICEYIIRHYNAGWADGFHLNIEYWEIWNEPDVGFDKETNMMWQGTPEEYFDLYRITSKHLRASFGNTIKIGGYGSCGFYATYEALPEESNAYGVKVELDEATRRKLWHVSFFDKFLEVVIKEKLPLDFFSYHSYDRIYNTVKMQDYVERKLQDAGLTGTEIHLNEWNANVYARGTATACAGAVASMCAMQYRKMAMMCYYDARIGVSVYGGLFNPLTCEPFCAYYGFKAFGKLFALGTQTACTWDNPDLYAVSATNGVKNGLLIANIGEDSEVVTNLDQNMQAYLIDETHFMEKVSINPEQFVLKKDQVLYLESE